MHKWGYLLPIIDGAGASVHAKQLFVFQETAVVGIQFLVFPNVTGRNMAR